MHSISDGNIPPISNTTLAFGLTSLVLLSTGVFTPLLADAFHIKNHIVSLGGCLLFLACLPAQHIRLPSVVRVALLACMCAILISCLAATQATIAWRACFELLPLGLIFYLLTQQQDKAQTACLLERAWMAAALGVAVFALLQTVKPQWLDLGFSGAEKLATFSTLGNPIWASIVFVVAIPLALNMAHKGPRWLWLLPTVLLAGLWATQSRQAWLALVLMGWIATIWKGGLWPRRVALTAALVLLCVLPFVNFSANAVHSMQGRLLIMRGAWQMFLDHPLAGVGLGHVGAEYPSYQAALFTNPAWQLYYGHAAVIEDAHNEFLQWAATTGALGLGGLTLLCGAISWLGWHSTRVKEQLWHWYLGYLGLLVTLMFTGIQAQSALVLLLVCCMAVLLSGTQPPDKWRSYNGHVRRGLVVATVVLTVLAGLWAQQDLRAGYLEGQGDRLMQERDAWLARETYEQALEVDAQRGSLLRKHASTLYLDGRFAEALTELSEAKTLSGDTGIALLQAEILARTGRDIEAIAAYQAIVASFPQLLTPRFILGQLHYKQRQTVQARAEFQRVLQTEPSAFNQLLSREKVQQQKQMAAVFIAILDRQNFEFVSANHK